MVFPRKAKELHLQSSGTKDDLIRRIHRHNNPPASDSVVARTCKEMADIGLLEGAADPSVEHSEHNVHAPAPADTRDETGSEQDRICIRQDNDTAYHRPSAAWIRACDNYMKTNADIEKYITLEKVIGEAGEAAAAEAAEAQAAADRIAEAQAAAAECVHLARSIQKDVEKGVYKKTKRGITATSVKIAGVVKPFIGVNKEAREMKQKYYKRIQDKFNKQLKEHRSIEAQKLRAMKEQKNEILSKLKSELRLDPTKQSEIYKDALKVVELKQPLSRDPETCAEADAYGQYYRHLYNNPDAPKESTFVTIRREQNGQYHTVKRCNNCLIYCKIMGKCKTDVAETPVPVGYAPDAYCHLSQHISYN